MPFKENIERLAKLVPVYVITLLSAVSGFFQAFYDEDPVYARWAIVVIMIISIIMTVTIEIFVLKSKKILEITIAAISGVLWIFFINLRFFDLPNIWVITIQFVTTIYTIIIGLFSQYLAS